jgi:hypothetical protein
MALKARRARCRVSDQMARHLDGVLGHPSLPDAVARRRLSSGAGNDGVVLRWFAAARRGHRDQAGRANQRLCSTRVHGRPAAMHEMHPFPPVD